MSAPTLTEFLSARIAAKIDVTDGCWLWTGSDSGNGYGRVTHPQTKRTVAAHRLVYEAMRGPIPDGLQLDHLCRVRACVNPAHLEPVTQRVNLLRGETIVAACATATHCPSGHPYSGDNLAILPNGERRCRECHRVREARVRAADPEASRERQRRYDATYRRKKREIAQSTAQHPDYRAEWGV